MKKVIGALTIIAGISLSVNHLEARHSFDKIGRGLRKAGQKVGQFVKRQLFGEDEESGQAAGNQGQDQLQKDLVAVVQEIRRLEQGADPLKTVTNQTLSAEEIARIIVKQHQLAELTKAAQEAGYILHPAAA